MCYSVIDKKSLSFIKQFLVTALLGLFVWIPFLRADVPYPHCTPDALFPQLIEIYKVANKKAPSLLREIQNISEAEGMGYLFSSDKLPNINFGLNAGYERRERERGKDSDEFRNFFNLSLDHPIYHWGGVDARDRIGQIDINLAKEEYQRFYQNLAQEIRVLYLSLIIENVSLRNTQLEEEITRKSLASLEDKQRQGLLSDDDYTLQHIQLQETLLNILKNKKKGQRLLRRLIYISGYEQLKLDNLPAEVPRPSLETDTFQQFLSSFFEGGYKENPIHSLNAKRIQREKENLKFIESNNRPLLDILLSAHQIQDNTATFNDVDTLIYFGGVRLTWNIFDGFATKGRKIASMARIRLLEQRQEGINNELNRDAREMASDLDLAYQSLQLNEARFPFTQKFWDRDKQLNEQNRLSELEFLESRLNYFNKQKELFMARSNFILDFSELLSLIGQDPALLYFTLPAE